ncbi:MAG: hypothetical protein ACK4YP_17095 [Myxococcota bacterium]
MNPRAPLADDRAAALLRRMTEHPDAPRWNHAAGDRLTADDLAAVRRFADALAEGRCPRAPGEVPDVVLARLAGLRVAEPLDVSDWARVPTTSREDLVLRPERWIPADADLTRLICYRTAGTTGHATLVPHHPRAAACYQPLVRYALSKHGVAFSPTPDAVACVNVGAQARTVTYPCTLAAWDGAGFAKINLSAAEWPRDGAAARWLADMAPPLLTGDPISFAELHRQRIPVRPAAMLTTAVGLAENVRRRLSEAFGCPVVDWYSLTETGPVGYRCPEGPGFHVLPHDLHVEALRADGTIADPGERGEITVSGGRNPYWPLVRYRTGDWGRLDHTPCGCGDPMPRILDLEGRAPVLFRAEGGTLVNPVDLARTLREHPLVQHELCQHPDRSLVLTVRVLDGARLDEDRLRAELAALLGPLPLALVEDPTLGDRGGKVLPWKGLALLEE